MLFFLGGGVCVIFCYSVVYLLIPILVDIYVVSMCFAVGVAFL